MLLALLAVVAVTALPVRSAAAASGSVEEFSGELQAYARALEALPPASGECRASYARLDARDPLTVGVFFGFIDTARKNYVADGDFKQALIRQLTAGCRGSLQACGFAVAAGEPAAPNETRLLKSQGGRRVVVEVFDSSLSGDYAADVGRLASRQEARSRLAEEEYLAALQRDAVVLYAGHTRRFSGTGFHPPLDLTAASAASLLRRPFYLRVYDALRRSAAPPAVLGLFACHSREYYAGPLHASAPGAALIVTPDSSGHENNLLGLFGAVNAVLARPCYEGALKNVNADGTPVFRVYGLFDRALHPRYTRYLDGRVVLLGLLLIPLLILASEREATADASWPARPGGAWRGTAVLTLGLVPASLAARAFTNQTLMLPVLLSLVGILSLALAVARGRLSISTFAHAARQAWPALFVFLLVYLGANLAREASVDNALSALRQAAALALVFALLWPFAVFSEEALLGPFVGEPAGLVPACLHALAFYLAVWLSLCALAPVYKPRLWPVIALALYGRVLSFGLHRRQRNVLLPALAQALTLALIITEGLHALVYN